MSSNTAVPGTYLVVKRLNTSRPVGAIRNKRYPVFNSHHHDSMPACSSGDWLKEDQSSTSTSIETYLEYVVQQQSWHILLRMRSSLRVKVGAKITTIRAVLCSRDIPSVYGRSLALLGFQTYRRAHAITGTEEQQRYHCCRCYSYKRTEWRWLV